MKKVFLAFIFALLFTCTGLADGMEYGMEIDSKKDKGTSIKIVIPAIIKDQAEE